jgi:sulfur-oxidizing protein SoxX
MKTLLHTTILLCVIVLAACSRGPDAPRGFSLPRGDAEAGKMAFVALECNACHSAEGVEQIAPDQAEIALRLGGHRALVTTYAELVTSIINPSHRLSNRYPETKSAVDGESRMRSYNEVMTVQQLVDLVAYLQPQYKVVPSSPTEYPLYYP